MVSAIIFEWLKFIFVAFVVAAFITIPTMLLIWYFKIKKIQEHARKEYQGTRETSEGNRGEEGSIGEGTEGNRPDDNDGGQEDVPIPSPASTGRDKSFDRIFSTK